MKKPEKIISTFIALALILTILPGTTTTASPSVNHEVDDALLLMLANHKMLIDGWSASGHPRMAAVNPQTIDNEVKILSDFYRQQVNEVDRQGYGDHVKARLLLELDTKLQILEAKARRLDAERQNRRRGGLFGRFFRVLGRATGWVISKAMEGTGVIVQYSIEEVGPQLLKDAVFSGTPFTGAAFRAKLREMLRNRVRAVVERKIETRLTIIASEPEPQFYPTQPASAPTSSPPPQNQPAPQPMTAIQESTEETSLTPEEEANAGTHTYLIACYGEGCEYVDKSATTTITFSDGVMRMSSSYQSREYIWTKVDRNQYSWVNVDGDVMYILFTLNGFEFYVNSSDGKLVYILQP